MIDRTRQLMAAAVEALATQVAHALEDVLPFVEPPPKRRVTPLRVLAVLGVLGASAVAVALALSKSGPSGSTATSAQRPAGAGPSPTPGTAASTSAVASGSTPAMAPTSSGGSELPSADELSAMTKAELYQLATAEAVAGRSSMTKAQLIVALSQR